MASPAGIGGAEAAISLAQQVRFETLLADLSTRLLNLAPELVDDEINDALRRLGEHLDVDRGSIGTLDPVDEQLRTTHSWAREGIVAVPLGLGEADLPWAAAQIRAGIPIIFDRPDDVPAEAAADLATVVNRLGAQSAALLPLAAGGKIIGMVHFSTVTRTLQWPEPIVQRLRLIGEMFAGVLLRRDRETQLRCALAQVEELRERLELENACLREDALEAIAGGELVGDSDALRRVLLRIDQVAPTNATVLVLGETGVGKELVAKAIHSRSARRQATFVRVNCAALPASLIESELFGHEKGAFTGAAGRKLGRFELADGGTIFLDEVGELPLDLQAKLLRVLQDGSMERLGSQVTRRVDVRVVAATNRDLRTAAAGGAFRTDLYFRLAVFPIEVPPLRARKQDIPLLARHFLAQLRATVGKPIAGIGSAAVARLMAYDWPGNVRELRNVVERAMIVASGPTLQIDDVFDATHSPAGAPSPALVPADGAPRQTLEEVERAHILQVLQACNWRIRGRDRAAERLGLHPSTLYSRMEKLAIRRPS